MRIKSLAFDDKLWESVANYAYNCTWSAGKNLAVLMREYKFTDWEKVFVALENNDIAGYCTLTKADCIPSLGICERSGLR